MSAAVLFENLRRSLLDHPGATTRDAREAAMRGEGAYARQVQEAAYAITSEQVSALRATHPDDALFELTLCAAHGAATRRLEAGFKALAEAYGDDR